MTKLRVLDLFSGIGGFSLGLERTGGFETVAFCEIEDYPRRVLAKHWPGVPIYDDVRTLTGNRLAADGITADVICGGFPCQDLSTAGNQAGIDAERSGLWSKFARLVGELRPRFAIVENVSALLSGPSERPGQWFGRVLGDLATLGYDAEWNCIPASAVGAPHRRDRVWIIAYPGEVRCDAGRAAEPLQGTRLVGECFADQPMADADGIACAQGRASYATKIEGRRQSDRGGIVANVSDTEQSGLEGQQRPQFAAGAGTRFAIDVGAGRARFGTSQWGFEPELGRVADGIPNRVERIAALGNAVVPQIPEIIGLAILRSEARVGR